MNTDIVINRLAYNIPDACKVLSTSRQTLYDLINDGRLRSFKEGKRRYVSRAAIDDYIAAREQQRDSK
ncbi:MAG TPA: helix-turn-helix domain-containing protein [Candidatus Competibacter sp.]|nr:DNA-binding protein [Candidatus Competibacteraceae bacterium]HRE55218.1 helix-turn-helix domain-containing protein [Candidatus Competibacter sp.]HUM96102.1 helix-turn-helix domain-containing protein [Candidatus Competibacter sp.]